jgi:ribosomal protein S18 acetylase RimI-like enzyme
MAMSLAAGTAATTKKTAIKIRDAKLGDAPSLAALMCELGYETTSAEMQRRLKLILRDARCRTLVAEIGHQVCGMIGTLTHASHEHNDPSGEIVALVVSKKQRRSSIGRALIAAAEKDFAQRKVARVSLTTRFTRKEAHQFYEALGYSKTGFRFVKELQRLQTLRNSERSTRSIPRGVTTQISALAGRS